MCSNVVPFLNVVSSKMDHAEVVQSIGQSLTKSRTEFQLDLSIPHRMRALYSYSAISHGG